MQAMDVGVAVRKQRSDEKKWLEQVQLAENIQARLEALEKRAATALVSPPRPVFPPSPRTLSSTPFFNFPQIFTAPLHRCCLEQCVSFEQTFLMQM